MSNNKTNYISKEEVRIIVDSYFSGNAFIQNYKVDFASNNMLGFLCDYLKLSVHVTLRDKEKRVLKCFIKSISKSNQAKAEMVKEMKLYEKESRFYTIIKNIICTSDIKSWSPNLIVSLRDAMVFEDLNAFGYKMHNKLIPFDEAHILQALRTLARFHASSIIYEERKSKELNRCYNINEDFENDLNKGGYVLTDPWYVQCMIGALEVVKSHSKYAKNKNVLDMCDKKWRSVWKAALDLTDASSKYRNVICHRDLWNNNLMFHYDGAVPDDCLLVDFQAVRYHPPAGDIMILLYCNLEDSFRKINMSRLLRYYYCALGDILQQNSIDLETILTFKELQDSAKEFRLWGLVVSACLVPQFWINDELTTQIFTDSQKFDEILSKDKGSFIRTMCDGNQAYRYKVLRIFEEIVEEYVSN